MTSTTSERPSLMAAPPVQNGGGPLEERPIKIDVQRLSFFYGDVRTDGLISVIVYFYQMVCARSTLPLPPPLT